MNFARENYFKSGYIKALILNGLICALPTLANADWNPPQNQFPGWQYSAGSHFKKVVWIIFENTNYDKALKQADFARFSKKGVLFTNFVAEGHPSQGNYIAMIAGSNMGVSSDRNVNLGGEHLGDLLERSGKSWKAYAEDYPGNCYLGGSYKDYARKHLPFLSFKNVSTTPDRCAKIVDGPEFFEDLKNNRLPNFSMYVPNQKNDGHDTGVNFAGKWLQSKFGSILSNPERLGDTLYVITFDESGASSTNQIYTVLIGSRINAGTQNAQKLNHVSLLKLVEDEWDLGNLGRGDAKAAIVENLWMK